VEDRKEWKNSLLALGMEVNPAHGPCHLIETDIVKSLETGAHDLTHAVVRHQKRLFPAHEDVFALRVVLVVEVWFLGRFGQRAPGGKAGPVLHVGFVGGAPGCVAGLEGVFGADDFAFEVGG